MHHSEPIYDIAVIGAGINGAGIARDAAGRGLRVLLCERGDLAGHTSSASSKLIHGGLRYLEHYEFALVRKALIEREVVLASAPHLCRPLRFVMPHAPGLRPAWLIRAGLLLYDHLALGTRQSLPRSCALDLTRHPAGQALAAGYRHGFEYSDAWVDDARLVVSCVLDAHQRGATVLTRTGLTRARREAQVWALELQHADGSTRSAQARVLVNAAGPWAARLLQEALGRDDTPALRLVRGSHLVFARLFRHEHAYTLQHVDGRVVFALPFEQDFTLVGTTDVEQTGDPANARCSDAEAQYLCTALNRYLATPVHPRDAVHRFSGVRPLLDDGDARASAVSRDYRLDLDTAGAPLLSVLGGKLTTFRRLAEEALDRITAATGHGRTAWTARAVLPGGDLGAAGRDAFAAGLQARWPWLGSVLAHRLARAYGTRVERIIGSARRREDLGVDLGAGLHEAELDYLRREEWAAQADDVLWRRSKLGLRLDARQRDGVAAWLQRQRAAGAR
jgi:glycerol-3-phosphate dehydrogenase